MDGWLSRTEGATSRQFLTDALGSVIAATDSAGALKTQYPYEPYGRTTATGEASSNPFKYTGREDDGTGLYYYRARYYNPSFQRFISSDPIGLSGGLNTYEYANGNPLTFNNPSGNMPCVLIAGGVSFIVNIWTQNIQLFVNYATNGERFGDKTTVDWLDVTAATAGGAAGCAGGYLASIGIKNPVAQNAISNAIASMAQSVATQYINNRCVDQLKFVVDTGVGAFTGAIGTYGGTAARKAWNYFTPNVVDWTFDASGKVIDVTRAGRRLATDAASNGIAALSSPFNLKGCKPATK